MFPLKQQQYQQWLQNGKIKQFFWPCIHLGTSPDPKWAKVLLDHQSRSN